jgi:hypothetical protein
MTDMTAADVQTYVIRVTYCFKEVSPRYLLTRNDEIRKETTSDD